MTRRRGTWVGLGGICFGRRGGEGYDVAAGLGWEANGVEAASGMGESARMEVDGSKTEATASGVQGKRGADKATAIGILCGMWVLRRFVTEGWSEWEKSANKGRGVGKDGSMGMRRFH